MSIQTRSHSRNNLKDSQDIKEPITPLTSSSPVKNQNIIEATVWNYGDSPPSSLITTEPTEQLKVFILSQINSLKSHFQSSLNTQKDEIIKKLQNENTLLRSEIEELKGEIKVKSNLITDIERDVIDLQQYIRRNNIEICGIPESVSDKDLKSKVIDIASAIGVDIKKSDIEACHRLKVRKTNSDGPKRTIVRFVNREFCDRLHANKKKLKNKENRKVSNKLKNIGCIAGKIYINNNLCPYNRFLWGKCKQILLNS